MWMIKCHPGIRSTRSEYMAVRTRAKRTNALGAGIGIGVGIGAGWGIVMATIMDGEITTGLTIGAGAGLVIAVLSGAAVLRMADDGG